MFQGRIQRGNVLLKKGHFVEAANDFQYAVNKKIILNFFNLLFQAHSNPDHKEANEKIQTINVLFDWIKEADNYLKNNDYKNAEFLFEKSIEV